MSDVDDRIARLKEAKAKPTREDPAERDQLVVLANRILVEAEALREGRKRGEAASREQAEQWQHSLKQYASQIIQALRGDLEKVQAEHQQAVQQWGQRFTELESTNRLLAKGLLLLGSMLMALFGWEFFQ